MGPERSGSGLIEGSVALQGGVPPALVRGLAPHAGGLPDLLPGESCGPAGGCRALEAPLHGLLLTPGGGQLGQGDLPISVGPPLGVEGLQNGHRWIAGRPGPEARLSSVEIGSAGLVEPCPGLSLPEAGAGGAPAVHVIVLDEGEPFEALDHDRLGSERKGGPAVSENGDDGTAVAAVNGFPEHVRVS